MDTMDTMDIGDVSEAPTLQEFLDEPLKFLPKPEFLTTYLIDVMNLPLLYVQIIERQNIILSL